MGNNLAASSPRLSGAGSSNPHRSSQSSPTPKSEGEESEEEDGEIHLDPPTLSKSKKGKKTDKERREEATYRDKLIGAQATLDTMLNPRITRQKGPAKRGPHSTRGK